MTTEVEAQKVTEQIVVEHFQANVSAVEEATQAQEGKTKTRRFKAKVSHVDVVNGNNRIYPKEVFSKAISELKEKADGKSKLDSGYLTGAVDHAGWGQANLRETPIIWRSLAIESDGAVVGEFDLLLEHSAGKDLAIQIDGGMAIGFSTSSYCSMHPATEEEAKKYNLKYEPDGVPVWIAEKMRLVKIDAVDDPSEHSARLMESLIKDLEKRGFKISRLSEGSEIQPEPTVEPGKTDEKTNMPDEIKNLEDLKKAHPALVSELLKNASLEGLKPTAESINKFLESVKGIPGVSLPEKEVLPAEFADERRNLNTKIAELEKEVATGKTALEAANAKVKAFEDQAEAAKKHREMNEKLEAALKGADGKPIKFANEIRTLVSKSLSTLTPDKVEDEVKSVAKVFENLNPDPANVGATGSNEAPSDPTDEDIFANETDEDDLISPELKAYNEAKKVSKK